MEVEHNSHGNEIQKILPLHKETIVIQFYITFRCKTNNTFDQGTEVMRLMSSTHLPLEIMQIQAANNIVYDITDIVNNVLRVKCTYGYV